MSGLSWPEFLAIFPESSKIGQEPTEPHHWVSYFDNGKDVGIWTENRRTTMGEGEGEILDEENAAACRAHCERLAQEKGLEQTFVDRIKQNMRQARGR